MLAFAATIDTAGTLEAGDKLSDLWRHRSDLSAAQRPALRCAEQPFQYHETLRPEKRRARATGSTSLLGVSCSALLGGAIRGCSPQTPEVRLVTSTAMTSAASEER